MPVTSQELFVLGRVSSSDFTNWTSCIAANLVMIQLNRNFAFELEQVMLVHIEPPVEPMKDADRIWFPAIAHDVSGSLQVWVSEDAALAMADCTKQEFTERIKGFDLAFHPVNVKIVESQKDDKSYWIVGAAEEHNDLETHVM